MYIGPGPIREPFVSATPAASPFCCVAPGGRVNRRFRHPVAVADDVSNDAADPAAVPASVVYCRRWGGGGVVYSGEDRCFRALREAARRRT